MFGSITTCRRGFSVQTDAEEGVVFRVVSVMAGVSHTDIDTDVEVEVDVEVEGVIETTLAGVSVPTSFEFFSFAGMTATPDECGACVCCPDVVKIPNIPFLLLLFPSLSCRCFLCPVLYVLSDNHARIHEKTQRDIHARRNPTRQPQWSNTTSWRSSHPSLYPFDNLCANWLTALTPEFLPDEKGPKR